MVKKVKDKRGRLLRDGETQRPDGRYMYRWKGADGKDHYVYSWRLEKTDSIVKGKRDGESLREKERQIKRDMDAGVAYKGGGMDVCSLVKKYVGLKQGVRNSTKRGYRTVINLLETERFGEKPISDVKISDAKEFILYLNKEKGKKYSTLHTLRGVLNGSFKTAVEDGLIGKNPFSFSLSEVVKNDMKKREALSKEQEDKFMSFLKNDEYFSRYYDAVYILFNTGMRISEYCGLTVDDIDLEEGTINIDHQLIRAGMDYIIEEPKSRNGKRKLPMVKEVRACFERIIRARKKPGKEPSVDGRKGFLHLDKNSMPVIALHWEKYFGHAVEKYNRGNDDKLPEITPHVCRHTYCTRMVQSGMNVKAVQYLMGHSDIGTTLGVYTHARYEDAREELEKLQGGSLQAGKGEGA